MIRRVWNFFWWSYQRYLQKFQNWCHFILVFRAPKTVTCCFAVAAMIRVCPHDETEWMDWTADLLPFRCWKSAVSGTRPNSWCCASTAARMLPYCSTWPAPWSGTSTPSTAPVPCRPSGCTPPTPSQRCAPSSTARCRSKYQSYWALKQTNIINIYRDIFASLKKFGDDYVCSFFSANAWVFRTLSWVCYPHTITIMFWIEVYQESVHTTSAAVTLLLQLFPCKLICFIDNWSFSLVDIVYLIDYMLKLSLLLSLDFKYVTFANVGRVLVNLVRSHPF